MNKIISCIGSLFAFASICYGVGVYPEEEINPAVDLSGLTIKLHIGTSGSIQVGWSSSLDGSFGWFYDGWLDFSGLPESGGFQEFHMDPNNDVLTCNVINVDPEPGKDWIVRCKEGSFARIVWLEMYGDGGSYTGPTRLSDTFASLIVLGGVEFWIDLDSSGTPRIRSGAMPNDFDIYIEFGISNPSPRRSGVYSDICDSGTTPETWESLSSMITKSNRGKHLGKQIK